MAFLEISRSPLLTGVSGLQHSVWNVTKSKLLIKFLKCIMKLTENFQEVTFTEGLHQKLTDLQTAALPDFKVNEPRYSNVG